MIIRNSFKTIWRMKWKSSLLLLLIAASTTFLGLGISLLSACSTLLNRLENDYTTIALVEYVGKDYPDNDIYDADAEAAFKALDFSKGQDFIINNDPPKLALGEIEGYKKNSSQMVYGNFAVLEFTVYRINEYSITGLVNRQLYASGDEVAKLAILDFNGTGIDVESVYKGQSFLCCGSYSYGVSSMRTFRIHGFGDYLTGADFHPIIDVTDLKFDITSPEIKPFADMAKTLESANNSVSVHATNNLQLLEEFHEGTNFIKYGSTFDESDYSGNARVCAISETAASILDVKVGDRIRLSLVQPGGEKMYSRFDSVSSPSDFEDYVVKGIFFAADNYTSTVYIPEQSEPFGFYGYTIGSIQLKNGTGEDFLSSIGELPPRVTVAIYDFGYGIARESLDMLLSRALLLTIAASVCALAVILLFGYIFISKQRDTVTAMHSLGTSRAKIYLFLLFGAGIILLLAVTVGAVAGYALSGNIAAISEASVADTETNNYLYSNSALGIIKPFEFNFAIGFDKIVLAAVICLASGFALSAIFASATMKKPKAKVKRVKKVRVINRKAVGMGRGGMAFILSSIFRGGFRTAAVSILSAVMVVFLILLSAAGQSYREKLRTLRENTEITGYFSSYSNKAPFSIVAYGRVLNDFMDFGLVEDISLSQHDFYQFIGITEAADGRETAELTYPEVPPESSFAFETYMNALHRSSSDIIFTNDYYCTKEFFYSHQIITEYLDGYDDSFLRGDNGELCVISTEMMQEKDIRLGDTLCFLVGDGFNRFDLKVIGCFEKQIGQQNVYVPLINVFDIKLFNDEYAESVLEANKKKMYDELLESWGAEYIEEIEEFVSRYNNNIDSMINSYEFNCVKFNIGNASNINPFKDKLSEHKFSMVRKANSIRTFVVVEDKDFIETEKKLTRQIKYMDILYPLMIALVTAVGFIVSYLIISGRRTELAIMRGLGTKPLRVFSTFFSEQMMLCLAGCLIGCGGWAIYSSFGISELTSAVWFALGYIAGAAFAVVLLNKRKLLSVLTAED